MFLLVSEGIIESSVLESQSQHNWERLVSGFHTSLKS